MRHSLNRKSGLRGRVVVEWKTIVDMVNTAVCFLNGMHWKGRIEKGLHADRPETYAHVAQVPKSLLRVNEFLNSTTSVANIVYAYDVRCLRRLGKLEIILTRLILTYSFFNTLPSINPFLAQQYLKSPSFNPFTVIHHKDSYPAISPTLPSLCATGEPVLIAGVFQGFELAIAHAFAAADICI